MERAPKSRVTKQRKGVTPKLPAVSEQMKAWSSALAAELGGWPRVTTKSFFGFTALYRDQSIFGVLPRTRAWGNRNTLAFKLENPISKLRTRLENDRRIGSMDLQKIPLVHLGPLFGCRPARCH